MVKSPGHVGRREEPQTRGSAVRTPLATLGRGPALTAISNFISTLLWFPQALHAHGAHTWRQNNRIHKK